MKKILTILLLILIIYPFLPDVDYAEGVDDWLTVESVQIDEKDNLFSGIAGFTASADKNPFTEGQRLIISANQALEEYLQTYSYLEKEHQPVFEVQWEQPALTITEDISILCDPRIKDCLDIWITQSDTIEKIVSENSVLLDRYKTLQKTKNYRNDLVNDIRSPIPDLKVLMEVNRLYGMKTALQFISGDHEAAILALKNDFSFLKGLLEKADLLILKMVALSMLKHDFYVYSTLIDATDPSESYLFDDLPLLTGSEMSFENCIKNEFRMNAKLINEINQYPQIYIKDFYLSGRVPFPFFRKNHSTNMVYNVFNKILSDNGLSSSDFYQSRLSGENTAKQFKPDWLDYFYNPIGSILFSVSMPDYDKYIIRMHDMDGLIMMINVKRSIKADNVDKDDLDNYLEEIKSRYFDPYTGEGIHWNEAAHKLWIQNPLSQQINNELSIQFRK